MTSTEPDPVFDPPRRLPPGNTAQFEKEFKELLGEPSESLTTYAMQHALRLTRGNQQDAEDLAQDAYVRILKARFSKPANGRAYITDILTKLFIDVVRRRQTVTKKLGSRTGYEIALDEGVQDRTGGDVADIAVRSVFSREVHNQINAVGPCLPSEDLRVLLQAWVDLDNGELRDGQTIETLTGFSASKVKRLRAALKPLLQDALDGLNDPEQTA